MIRHSLLVLTALTLVACGVPLDSEPRLYGHEVRAAVEAAVAPPVAGIDEEGTGGALVDLFFVADDRLAAVRRRIPSSAPRLIVLALIEGPGAVEEGLDLRTAIPPATLVRSVSISGRVAKVDLSRDFAVVGGEEEILAVAQVVVTLAARPEIDGVMFALDGVATGVPRADGALVDGPLTIADFRPLVVEEEQID